MILGRFLPWIPCSNEEILWPLNTDMCCAFSILPDVLPMNVAWVGDRCQGVNGVWDNSVLVV